MNILFLTLLNIDFVNERNIYSDLLKKFESENHQVYAVCPNERRLRKKTELIKSQNTTVLRVKTLNIQKTNLIEKGLGILAIEYQYLIAIKKYFKKIKFDLVLYSTPPITFTRVVKYIKKRDDAYSYLLLKDIFPQNAVDMKFIKKNGLLHKFFLRKEKKLYKVSDMIGCLSKANVDYLKINNPDIEFNKIEINPNTISPKHINYSDQDKQAIKHKYQIPKDKKIFAYGGNLGKPQGIDFLLEIIQYTKRTDVYFLIIGSGTEFNRIKVWFENINPQNATLLSFLPKNDYDKLLAACDVGLIFLHKGFTIPNYPSRLLSYLEMKMPVIAATDTATDIGIDLEKNNCGYWIVSGDIDGFHIAINNLVNDDQFFKLAKDNAWNFLTKEFTVDKSYSLIIEKL